MKNKKIEDRWMGLFSSVDNSSIVKEGLRQLVARYSETHRHYHTLHHVNACLEQLNEVVDYIVDPFNIESAIWFHDVIYDPKRDDNEDMSAKYAKASLESIGLSSNVIAQIEHLILLTKHPSNPITSDEKYLIDIDLSTLAANEELYDSYELSIRKEYAFVPDLLYKAGRKKILNAFSNLDRIYRTDYFYEKYESRARKNIDRALLMI